MFRETACEGLLEITSYNASSMSEFVDSPERISENEDSRDQFVKWHANPNNPYPWLELKLFNRSNITGQEARRMYTSYILYT